MVKKGPEGGLLRALQSAMRQKGEPPAQNGAGEATAAANSASAVGEKLIQNLAASLNVNPEEAAALLLESAPNGLKGLSGRAASELFRRKQENALSGEPEDYISDPAFLALLSEMPAKAALRVYEAEKVLKEAQAALQTAREDGARDLMEKFSARKALPAPLRQGALSAPETDFSTMSSEQFRALKNQYSRAAQQRYGAK